VEGEWRKVKGSGSEGKRRGVGVSASERGS
jgi:hypothetical protein